MRRRRDDQADPSKPPPMPDFGPPPRCQAKYPRHLGYGSGNRPPPPCGNCDAVHAFNGALEDYRADLAAWRDSIITDRTPVDIVLAVSQCRQDLPASPICWTRI